MPAFDQAKGGLLNAAQVKVLAEGIKQKWNHDDSLGNEPPYSMAPYGDAKRGAEVFVTSCGMSRSKRTGRDVQ